MGLDVGEDRLLAQVVADHVRDVRVDALVVGRPPSRHVGQGDVPEPEGVQQAGHAEQGVRAEHEGVEEVVVDAAVDHVDPPQPLGGAHVDEAVPDQQVPPFDQRRAELLREEHVLVEGGVVDPGGEQDDAGVGSPAGSELAQGLAQHAPVVLDFAHPTTAVDAAQVPLHDLAVGDHVGHARRYPQVVLQDLEAVVRAHQIGAADGDPGAVGHVDPAHLDAVLGTAAHQVGGDHPVGDDAGLAVDVSEKALRASMRWERPDSSSRQSAPETMRGTQSMGMMRSSASSSSVDGERDALGRKRARDPRLHAREIVVGEPAQRIEQRPALLPGRAVGEEHLVVERRIEIVRHRSSWRGLVTPGTVRHASAPRDTLFPGGRS